MARHDPPAVHLPASPAERPPTTGSQDLGPLVATAEVDDGFEWLRADTLRVLLYALAGALWLVLVRYLAQPNAFWPGWGSALLALAVVVGAHALAPRSYPLASSVLVAGLAIVVTARTVGGIHDGVALSLYIPVVLMAGTLQRTRAAVLVASLATLTLVGHAALGTASIGAGAAMEVLAVIWLTALTSWLVTRNLYTALHWSWQSQELARRNLDAARRHRGELAQALRQLEDATHRLERLNHALNWARLEAEEAREVKARFAAHVSHELRTPINLIVGFSDMMLNVPESYGGARLPTAYQADLQTLNRSATHLQGLIDDILDLSQLDAKEMPLMRQQVQIDAVIRQAAATIRPLIERKGLALQLELSSDMPAVYVDPLRVRQVLLNLLSNASRHTPAGGITIRAWLNDAKAYISVSDTGDGIDPRDLPHLFEAFHRLAPSAASAHEGWGLGLAICKQFIALHGGTIEAASEGIPGRGTTFTIALPTSPVPLPVTAPPQRGPLSLGGQRSADTTTTNIVALESDPHVVSLLRRYLRDYQVHGAATETEALDLAWRLSAHAILVPAPPSSRQAAWQQHWSALAADRNVRIVGCSISSSQQLIEATGLDGYLVKPVARDTLLATIQRVCPRVRKVAIVEDDTHMVRMLSRMLRSSGQPPRIVRAYNGRDGLAIIRRVRPDLVLLDLGLPDLDGLTLLASLRNDPALSEVAVVAVSAKDAAEFLPAPGGTLLTLLSSRGLTLSKTLRGVQGLLEVLPPLEIDEIGPDLAPAGGPLVSAVSG